MIDTCVPGGLEKFKQLPEDRKRAIADRPSRNLATDVGQAQQMRWLRAIVCSGLRTWMRVNG